MAEGIFSARGSPEAYAAEDQHLSPPARAGLLRQGLPKTFPPRLGPLLLTPLRPLSRLPLLGLGRGADQARSLDHLIRPLQERRRDREAEGPGGLEVDHQLELRRLLDGEVGRLGALENLIDVNRRALPGAIDVWSVAHEPASIDKVPPRKHAR